MSSGEANSSGRWLQPLRQGMKTIPVGAICGGGVRSKWVGEEEGSWLGLCSHARAPARPAAPKEQPLTRTRAHPPSPPPRIHFDMIEMQCSANSFLAFLSSGRTSCDRPVSENPKERGAESAGTARNGTHCWPPAPGMK